MASFVVYIDHENAKIFKMGAEGTSEVQLHRHVHLHHKNNNEDKKKDHSPFYHEVATALDSAAEVLVVGHGNAKEQFVHHLKEHKHDKLASKIVGVESVDKPTDNQILALARKFFKSAHLFTT